MKQNKLKSLLSPLTTLIKFFSESKIKNIIIGGVAASLLGKARFTADIDSLIFVDDENLADFFKTAAKYGLLPRIKDVLEFALKNRVILLKHQASNINIDLSLGLLPFEMQALKRSRNFKIGKLQIVLPTPEDLIIMKAVANRPIDLEDIRNILEINPKLDVKYIKYWVKEFSEILELPEMYEGIKKLLADRTR